MCEQKPRHELKLFINHSDYLTLKSRLKFIAKMDENAGANGGYTISSLYFDNFADKALREKVDGVNCREKFRIRYYNNDTNYICLEKKSKQNGLCYKEGEQITKEECQKLLHGDYAFLRDSHKPLFCELYAKLAGQQLRPKTIVVYEREPYVYPVGNVRITLDKSIRTGLASLDFFNPQLPMVKTGSGIILEVKYDAFLPGIIKDTIGLSSRHTAAFSKYAACRMGV